MTLKHFHLLFVTTAVLVALFCAAQAFGAYRAEGQASMGGLAALSVVAAALLVRFEVLFLRQCRKEGM